MAKTPKAPKAAAVVRPSLKLTEFEASNVAEVIAATGATKSGKLIMVPVDSIYVIPGFNVRITDSPEYREGIAELAESITTEGFYDTQPLGCYPAVIEGEPKMALISGHRRYEAALKAIADGAEIERLPVVLKKPTSSSIDLAVSLHKENTGVRPSMMERAVLAKRLLATGLSEAEVASRLNVTERHVSDLKVLIGAPKAVRDLVSGGKISPTEAVTQLRKDGGADKIIAAAAKAEEKAAERAAAKGATAGKAEKLTRQSIENDGAPVVKMQTFRNNFAVKTGEVFVFEDAEPYLKLIGEQDWFKASRKKTERVALEPIEVEVKIRRQKSAAETEAEAEAAAAATAKGAKGKKPAPAADELDDSTVDDGFDDAPNLRDLGIVGDPVNAEL